MEGTISVRVTPLLFPDYGAFLLSPFRQQDSKISKTACIGTGVPEDPWSEIADPLLYLAWLSTDWLTPMMKPTSRSPWSSGEPMRACHGAARGCWRFFFSSSSQAPGLRQARYHELKAQNPRSRGRLQLRGSVFLPHNPHPVLTATRSQTRDPVRHPQNPTLRLVMWRTCRTHAEYDGYYSRDRRDKFACGSDLPQRTERGVLQTGGFKMCMGAPNNSPVTKSDH